LGESDGEQHKPVLALVEERLEGGGRVVGAATLAVTPHFWVRGKSNATKGTPRTFYVLILIDYVNKFSVVKNFILIDQCILSTLKLWVDAQRAKKMELNPNQQRAVDLALAGESLFLTGPAGVGKSFTLKHIITKLKEQHGKGAVYVTASTGTAALAIRGITLHSFAGVGLGTASVDELVKRMKKSAKTNWNKCVVLVVDEISMISCTLFSKLDYIGRIVREKCGAPFGGIQLVLCGDFFQLPPVPDKAEPPNTPRFAFQSPSWKVAVPNVVHLETIYRQNNSTFVRLLMGLRRGFVHPQIHDVLDPCYQQDDEDRETVIQHTKLYPLRRDVDKENDSHLNNLNAIKDVYVAKDSGDQEYMNQLRKNCPAQDELTLSVGAQVILLKNLDVHVGLVNGSRGVVTELKEGEGPVVLFFNGVSMTMERAEFSFEVAGKVVATRWQIPLALAWAISIHKSQGMSIDKLYVDLRGVFEYGQAYVALSRARTLEGLKLAKFDARVIRAHPAVVKYYDEIV